MTAFSIKILNQQWISADKSEKDLCSHGKFELIIGNEKILYEEEELDWTLSTSTLNLLRCIESDHIAKDNFELILHCGALLMQSCPIGLYLDLKHLDDKIIIENVKKQYGVSNHQFTSFSNIKVEITQRDFALSVLKVAEEILIFFERQPKRVFICNDDKMLWNTFWMEFYRLYEDGKKKYPDHTEVYDS